MPRKVGDMRVWLVLVIALGAFVPDLPAGHRYVYHPDLEELMVEKEL